MKWTCLIKWNKHVNVIILAIYSLFSPFSLISEKVQLSCPYLFPLPEFSLDLISLRLLWLTPSSFLAGTTAKAYKQTSSATRSHHSGRPSCIPVPKKVFFIKCRSHCVTPLCLKSLRWIPRVSGWSLNNSH